MRHRRLLVGLGTIVVLAAALLAGGWLWQQHQAKRAAALRVPVRGGDGGGLPIASPVDEHLDAAALERIPDAPAAAGLQVFLVMRHGHLVLARYGRGLNADAVIDSGPWARVLVALAAGAALQSGTLPISALSGFDPERLEAAVERATHQSYPQYLSSEIWSRLNAAPAWIALAAPGAPLPADCCFHARVQDWLRIAELLIDDGNFEGTQVLRPGWVARMRLPISMDGAHGFGVELPTPQQRSRYEAADVCWLRGPGRWRIWMIPSLRLAVLFGAPGGRDWDETSLPNLVVEALRDRSSPGPSPSPMRALVPGH